MTPKKPAEIAKEAFKLLAERRLLPTPDNYESVYLEIQGTPGTPHFPEDALRKVVLALPAHDTTLAKAVASVEDAISQHNWAAMRNSLLDYVTKVEHLGAEVGNGDSKVSMELREQIARLVEHVSPALGSEDERFNGQIKDLLQVLRNASADTVQVKTVLSNFNLRVSFVGEEQGAVRLTLLHLLNLVFENISALGIEDRWLVGQVDALMEATRPPLNLKRLDDVKRKLQDVIVKQTEAKQRSLEAQAQIKMMLATFIERLSQMTDTTGQFRNEVDHFAKVIEKAEAFEEIGPALQSVLSATRSMEESARQVGDELKSIRDRAMRAEEEIIKLQSELDKASVQARLDPLTGALNRRGLDEAFAREVLGARKRGSNLCLAMLDIDNFKQLNDQLGHESGDAALSHLVSVARASIRPQDTLARYGGEEFIVLLPDTVLQHGVETVQRLQRELTKHLFLQNNQHVLITFSAGVAQLGAEESAEDAIKRADHAMYLAKRAGKNRVFAAG
ncbi:GGDEF domain-containing protein [Hydrogenophaga soli]